MTTPRPPATLLRAAAVLAALVAATAILGWATGHPTLTSLVPGLATMKVNTAVCFLLTAAALWTVPAAPGRAGFFGKICALLVVLVAGLSLAQTLSGRSFGIDELLLRQPEAGTLHPGRMAPNTAAAFLLLATSLLTLSGAGARGRLAVAGVLAAVAALVGTYGTIGYLGAFVAGRGWGELTSMALNTGALFALLGATSALAAWRVAGLRWMVWRTLTAGFLLGLGLLAALALYSYNSVRAFDETADWVRHTHEVQATLRGVGERLVEGEIAMRDYAMGGADSLIDEIKARLAEAQAGEVELRRLTADNASQQVRLKMLLPLLRQQGDFALEVVAMRQARDVAAAIRLMATGRGLAIKARVDALLEEMDAEEQRLLRIRETKAKAAARVVFYVVPIGTFAGIGVLLAVFAFLNVEVGRRQRSEEQALLSAETQKATLNALPAHLALLDPQGVIVAVNEAWRRYGEANLLQTNDFAVGKNYLDVCQTAHGDCSEEAHAAAAGILRVLRGEAKEFALEYPCHSPDEKRWFRLMVTPVSDDKLEGAVVMHVNITERRLGEEALRDSEERFRAHVEQAADCMFIHDDAGRFLDVNPQACASLGYSREELLEMNLFDVEMTFDLARAQEAWNGLVPGQPFLLTGVQRRKDGSTFPVEARLGCFDQKGERCYFAMVRDISAQRHAQEAIRRQALMLDQVGQSIIATDMTGVIAYVNRAACELYGWEAEEITGRNVVDVIVPQASQEQGAEIMRRLQAGETWGGEFLVQTRSGRVFPAYVTDAPLLDDAGRLVGIIGVSTDISERRQAEQKLAEQLAELRRWQAVMLERTDRSGELKREVNALLVRLGETIRYSSQPPEAPKT